MNLELFDKIKVIIRKFASDDIVFLGNKKYKNSITYRKEMKECMNHNAPT